MARISRKPRTQTQDSLSYGQTDTDGDEGTEKGGGKDPQAELLAQIATLTQRVERAEATNMALMTQAPVQHTKQEPFQAPALDVSKLPSPIEDPSGYAQALQAHTQSVVSAYLTNAQGQNSAESDQKNRLEKLWGRFEDKYEDYAGNQERVEFATLQVANEARARGLDLNRYMFGASDQFLDDVAKKMDTIFGKPNAKEEEEDEKTERNSPDGRTGGIFGGMESGGKPARGRQTDDGGDMIKEIHDIQIKSGFY